MSCNQGACSDPVLRGLVECKHKNQVRPIIGVDVDDVLADLLKEWLLCYSTEWGHDLRPEHLTSWYITKHVVPECGELIFNYLKDPTLYERVEPYPGALEAVNRLREIGRVVFVTSCEGPVQRDQKYAWLQRHGFLEPGHKQGADYITCKDKWLIGADFLVDDGAHNVEAFPRHSLLVTRPHNRSHVLKHGVRISELSEAPDRIRIILG